MELDISYCLAQKNMKLFRTELDILQAKKCGITYIFSHYIVKIKVDCYDSLPIEKRLTLHVIIHLNQFLIRIKITTTIKYF